MPQPSVPGATGSSSTRHSPSRGIARPSDAIDLYDALAALTPARRALILLHYYAGLSAKEIAMTVALPASTVRFQLMLARRALRIALTTPDERSTRLTSEALHDV
jgi:RNA polymerase sigma factor (sigma-70 family)